MAEVAKEYGARILTVEHRFYGESLPSKMALATQLPYLTSAQALADVAMVIDAKKAENPLDTRFFTFGGSYAGALSAWFKELYPTHSCGSLSSSGVVNAIEQFTAFDTQVAAAVGATCAANVQGITAAFVAAIENGTEADNAAAKALFGLDAEMSDTDFYYMIADSAAMADQYGSKGDLCDMAAAATAAESNSTARSMFANFTSTFWGADFAHDCFYDTRCLHQRVPSSRWQPTARSWRWQKCNELAYLQDAPTDGTSLRAAALTLEVLEAQCNEVFGQVPNTSPVNDARGGNHPNATNVFYSNFQDDPWQAASVLKTLDDSQPFALAYCDGCGHCADLHASTDEGMFTVALCRRSRRRRCARHPSHRRRRRLAPAPPRLNLTPPTTLQTRLSSQTSACSSGSTWIPGCRIASSRERGTSSY